MKLQVPFVQLPLVFDAGLLAREIASVNETHWNTHPLGFRGNSALALISPHGNPGDDDLAGPMGPTPWLNSCPYLMQVLSALGTTLGRSRLMKLAGQSEVIAHVDTNYYWRERMRVHIPITTTPDVRFQAGEAEVHMATGECWIFDTWRRHRVVNDNNRERIHLVVDTVGGDGLWELIATGRSQSRTSIGWTPRLVDFDPAGPTPMLDYESVNVPLVMSPWEIREHLVFMLGEVIPDGRLPAIQQTLLGFSRRWHALWSCHGEGREGWPRYRALLDETQASLIEQGINEIGLRNEVGLMFALRSCVFDFALADQDEVILSSRKDPHGSRSMPGDAAVGTESTSNPDAAFDRPVFIVSPPRSGSTLLFETLAQAPGVHTIGDESHSLIEGIPALSPSHRGHTSNRLLAADASAAVISELREKFHARLKDRELRPANRNVPARMLEKTPKNALRIPFLRSIFPDARFIFLYRDPRQVLGSMMDGWQSGDFEMYPNLPGWTGPAWSFLLTPGWQELIGKDIVEIVARQWQTTMNTVLDDLQMLPTDQWIAVDYAQFLDNPQSEISRLCQWANWNWDRSLGRKLPLSRYTMTAPDPEKWRRHAGQIEPWLPVIQPTIDRALSMFENRSA